MIIRPMVRLDKNAVLDMMRVFYASPAVLSNGSEEIFKNDIENCVNESPFLEGYIFEEDGMIQGYAMSIGEKVLEVNSLLLLRKNIRIAFCD